MCALGSRLSVPGLIYLALSKSGGVGLLAVTNYCYQKVHVGASGSCKALG